TCTVTGPRMMSGSWTRSVVGEKIARTNSFFFFQAEDGIRDKLVTGVQTCALPISRIAHDGARPAAARTGLLQLEEALRNAHLPRSEERRVGKECRSRWSPDL